jgi:hypothetical protein
MAVYEVNIFQQLINQHVPWVCSVWPRVTPPNAGPLLIPRTPVHRTQACAFLSHPPEGKLLERHQLSWDYRANKVSSSASAICLRSESKS